MILLVYSVFDKAVGNYLPPIYVRAPGEALRSFSDACQQADSNFYKHASDYTLYHLGSWDDSSGMFLCADPTRVISALECVVGVDRAAVTAAVEAGAGADGALREVATVTPSPTRLPR